MREITLEFKKIVGEGKALGRSEGKVVFCYGVLPDETARVRVTFEKKNFAEAELLEIITPSPRRVAPKEDHYLSCSPWQVMDYELQCETKKGLIEDLLYQTTKETIRLDKFYAAKQIFGYRTKIEYSFTGEPGALSFAFHKRGNFREKYLLPEGCALISPAANAAAVKVLAVLNGLKLSTADLKTLIIREAKNPGSRVAALFMKRQDIALPEMNIEGLDGFLAVYSNPISSVSQVDGIINSWGNDFVTEEILGSKFSYGFDCFFQNNMDLFEEALKEIRGAAFKCGKLVDLYSGVGVIGLTLRDLADKVYAVEASPNSAKYAALNAAANGATNFEMVCSLSEKTADDLFDGTDILVLDPPRAGLHNKVIKRIMEILPKKIIYLSCNPITQGRDAAFFMEKYKITRSAGFDFYPNTPHAETLIVFERD
ncbi:MAG: 23S rRNA (uracil-5-)-methyltransferase RumA [Elusimicrobia bacterium GWA2_61_42]|nr:MAG: 23S rRNA (uracil-5-)-methyltransferase RumA [Elusimicrobia bacterium GWA2_61_42]OGR75230.1 MAG: 23S rRNA (uracil-5-)-methyltransferase RumA [Elusimicrobia bacterium GWC2_61_25]